MTRRRAIQIQRRHGYPSAVNSYMTRLGTTQIPRWHAYPSAVNSYMTRLRATQIQRWHGYPSSTDFYVTRDSRFWCFPHLTPTPQCCTLIRFLLLFQPQKSNLLPLELKIHKGSKLFKTFYSAKYHTDSLIPLLSACKSYTQGGKLWVKHTQSSPCILCYNLFLCKWNHMHNFSKKEKEEREREVFSCFTGLLKAWCINMIILSSQIWHTKQDAMWFGCYRLYHMVTHKQQNELEQA